MKRCSLVLIGLLVSSGTGFAERADLCAELASFVSKQSAQSASSPPKEAATAVQAPSQGEKPQPGGSDQSQQSSGISGPVTAGGPGAAGPQAGAQESSASGAPNPKAQAAPPPPQQVQQPTPPPASAEKLQAAQAAAEKKDPAACRQAAQEMRRAGLDMPADLLALSALDVKFFGPQPAK